MHWWIVAIILILVIGELVRRRQQNQMLRRLHGLMQSGDDGAFLDLLESPGCKLIFSAATRTIMGLNLLARRGRTEEALLAYTTLETMRVKPTDKIAAAQMLFPLLIEGQHYDRAQELYKSVAPQMKASTSPEIQMLKLDMEQVLAIYLHHDISLIPDLETLLEAAPDSQVAATYQYRLAMLHTFAGDQAKARTLLRQALKNSENKQSQQKIQALLDKPRLEF